MTDRRSLVEGLKQTPAVDPLKEKEFVFQSKQPNGEGATAASTAATPPTVAKSPLSTRIRADFAAALKRASLERQLGGVEPHTVQDILEAALEPWLKSSGYLPS